MVIKRALATKAYTVTTLAVATLSDFGFSADNINEATRVVASTTANALMITWDGTDPTSALGHPIATNEWGNVDGPDATSVKLIATGGNAPTTITLER